MMKRYGDSIMRRILTLVIMTIVALTFLGCVDPMVADMEAQRQEIGFMVEQEFQRCRNAVKAHSRPISPSPVQAADMEAERRELDRMVERGDWNSLTPLPPTAQAEVFHPAP